jgi:hypothetical protein
MVTTTQSNRSGAKTASLIVTKHPKWGILVTEEHSVLASTSGDYCAEVTRLDAGQPLHSQGAFLSRCLLMPGSL